MKAGMKNGINIKRFNQTQIQNLLLLSLTYNKQIIIKIYILILILRFIITIIIEIN